jgi:predicted PurR-regulated permease PerM
VSAALKRQAVFWLIVIVAFFAGIYLFREILLPFVAGMAVAYLFDPVCDRLERAGLSRTLATTVVTAIFVAVLVLALLLLLPVVIGQLTSLIERLPDYIESLRGHLASVISALESRLSPEIMARIREALADSGGKIAGWITGLLTGLVSGGVALANLLPALADLHHAGGELLPAARLGPHRRPGRPLPAACFGRGGA